MVRSRSNQILLGFGQTTCRCGQARIYGQPCASCGRLNEPTEIDHGLNRRQRLVAFARNAPTDGAPVEPNKPVTSLAALEEFLEAASQTLNSLVLRANHAIDSVGEVGFVEFAEVVQRIAQLSDDAKLATRYRPFRALRDPLVRGGISLGQWRTRC